MDMERQADSSVVGMERDPLEEIDRAEAQVIADAVDLQREGRDVSALMRRLDSLALERMRIEGRRVPRAA
jgi:hypothetical protein